MKRLFLTLPLLALVGCGGGGGTIVDTQNQGWHFQGRNCLACHNVDLSQEKHLLVAGTLYKAPDVVNPDELSKTCGGELFIQFLDQNYNVVYDSRNYYDPNSKGLNGKGNFFILKRLLSNLSGNYYVRIVTKDGTLLSQSLTLHSFTDINSYKPRQNPADSLNRFSCNTCHTYPNPQGGAPGRLFPQANINLCR